MRRHPSFFGSHVLGFAALGMALSSCGSGDSKSSFTPNIPEPTVQKQLDPLPTQDGGSTPKETVIGVTVTLAASHDDSQNESKKDRRKADRHDRKDGVPPNRNVPDHSFSLTKFTRTLERTPLQLEVSTAGLKLPAGNIDISLYEGGQRIADISGTIAGKKAIKETLIFTTPQLSNDERAHGFAEIAYDIRVQSEKNPALLYHRPFKLAIYDETRPTYVAPVGQTCHVYMAPLQVSGCYQNHTRSTQEIVFSDGTNSQNTTTVDFTGGVSIPISIVTFSFGLEKDKQTSTGTSQGSEIHFTNCIECSSVVYRQNVITIQPGVVYWMKSDGSLDWAGQILAKSSGSSYEFESTPSESGNYNCNIPSQMPAGVEPGCESYQ